MSGGAELDVASRRVAVRRPRRIGVWRFVLLWGLALTPLASWGLPASDTDDLFFAGGAPWPVERYAAASAAEARRAATTATDVDIDPPADRGGFVELTADEAGRAAILRRFRLYSHQPDEMLTFMALQRMRPSAGEFDPGFYQYGGAYVYLIGASLGVAHLTGLAPISTNIDTYMAAPERFGRFYVVARVVSLAFACAALLGVYWLASRAGGRRAGWIAVLLLAFAPAFLTAALEAKPHMAASTLTIWAVCAALQYVRRGGAWIVAVGVLAGGAFAVLLSGAVALVIAPAILFVRRDRRTIAHVAVATMIALGVFAATNPYLIHHTLFQRELLTGNFGNTLGMYRIGSVVGSALAVLVFLQLSVGLTWIPGLVGVRALWLRWRWRTLIPAAPAVGLLVVFGAVAGGKPAEFARFLLTVSALLCVAGGALLARVSGWRRWVGVVAVVAFVVLEGAAAYIMNFARDANGRHETRRMAAVDLLDAAGPADAIGVIAEPAPYGCPPLDFARRRVVLLPGERPSVFAEPDMAAVVDLPEWLVACVDRVEALEGAPYMTAYRLWRSYGDGWWRRSPISWANKPTFVFRRRSIDLSASSSDMPPRTSRR